MPDRPGQASNADLPRTIGFWGATAIMVGIIIGSGIFATPSAIAKELGSPALVLLFWLVGGVITLFGALTFAELATAFPQSGGVYVFLREAYGRTMAFTFGWSYLLITKPLGAAGIAVVFANHLVQLLGFPRDSAALHHDPRLYTILVLTLLTWVNARGMRLGAGVAIGLTSIKFLVLLAIPTLAVALARGQSSNLSPGSNPTPLLLAIVPVMSAILWTYDGWSDVGAVSGEVRRPARTLPLAFLAGAGAITVVYLAVNAAYMWMIPLDAMRQTETVAPLVAERLFGAEAATLVTLLVLVSTLGSTQGSIITGARVSFQQARDGLLPRALAGVHPRHRTPAVSLWVQLAMSCLCVAFLGTFERLAGGFIFTMWIFYGLAGAAIFVLRAKRPDLERPYRCWGYPIVPALFVLSAGAMTALAIHADVTGGGMLVPTTLAWLGVLALGWPAHAMWKRWAEQRPRGL